jgi:hypothetical protein
MVKMSEFDINLDINPLKKNFKHMNHRFLNKLYANLLGYFWLPCPICGNCWGGHEIIFGGINNIPSNDDPHIHDMICPDCIRDGKGRY